jgi:hypothetical protein
VCQRLKARTLSSPVLDAIMKRSRGNPLYVVEVASHLADQKFIEVHLFCCRFAASLFSSPLSLMVRRGARQVNDDGECVVPAGRSLDDGALQMPNSLKARHAITTMIRRLFSSVTCLLLHRRWWCSALTRWAWTCSLCASWAARSGSTGSSENTSRSCSG